MSTLNESFTATALSTYEQSSDSIFDATMTMPEFLVHLGIAKGKASLAPKVGKISDYDGLASQGLVITNTVDGTSLYITLSKKLDPSDLATYASQLIVGAKVEGDETRIIAYLPGVTVGDAVSM